MRWIFISLVVMNLIFFVWKGLLAGDAPVGAVATTLPAVDKEVAELQLLSELAKAQLLAQRRGQNLLLLRSPDDSVESGEPLCTIVGPFSQLIAAENMVENLVALEVRAKLQDVEVPEGSAYWVYLPPESSRKAALKRLHELQAKNIDSYVIPKGNLANGISFGMYTRKPLSEARLAAMIAEGYDAKIHEIKRSHREVWVMLQPGEVDKVAAEFWDRLAEGEPNLQRRQNFCFALASEAKFH